MTVPTAHERALSVTSTETADAGPLPPPEENNENADGSLLARPERVRSESRDVSACSRNSRDDLRRNVSLRSNTFTESERMFLEQLTIEGSDQEVERALRIVEDEELFFEYTTPRHLKHQDPAFGLSIDASTSSGKEDDATRDGEAASVATSERRGLDKPVRSSLTSSSGRRGSQSSLGKPPIPRTIMGSQKRQAVLQRRRSDSSLNMATLWRAHETGLAVTSLGSQKSLIRRESSVSSFGSGMSGLSVIFGNRAHPGASQENIFRSDDAASIKESKIKSITPSKGKPPQPPRQCPPPGSRVPPMVRRSPHRRSKSATLFSPQRNLPKISEKAFGKPTHARAKSFSKRRSVTFHHIDEELEYDKNLESISVTAVDAVDTIPKHSQSDSHLAIPAEFQRELQRQTSVSSIPSIHHGTPIRQDSISSIPSLHHGTAVRSDSITSIPSIHRAVPFRDSMSVSGHSTSSIPSLHHANALHDSMSVMGQSTSSIPSLHHANPLRQDSVTSFASLHPGNPIRQESVSTIPSLHPGNPIRQESVSTIPSLHPGNPIRQESVSTIPSLHHGRPIRQDSVTSASIPPAAMTQEQMVRQFGVTDEIAAAWLQLSSSKSTMEAGHEKRASTISNITLPSLPDDVEIPHAPTEPTVSTAADAGEVVDMATPSTVRPSAMEDDGVSLLTPASNREAITGLLGSRQKPVLLRQATQNEYEGEGVEATEFDDTPLDGTLSETDSYYYQQPPDNSVFRTMSLFPNDGSIRTAGSFDDVSLYSSFGQQQRPSEVFRDIRRSLSDDNLSILGGGQNKEFLLQIPKSTDGTMAETFVDEMSEDDGSSAWEMEFASPAAGRFDAWNILQDEYANGYGGDGTLGFKILGTSANDESAQPHVLSPPLMESLQAFLPATKSGENFFMKYSMIRDGASLQTLLKRARGIQYSILAVETIDGEVFGSFTGQSWRKSWNYFGTGESFLWRMRHSRLEQTNGILDQAQKESEIDVYPYTGENDFIQLCTHDRIAVGGGLPGEEEKKTQNEPPPSPLVENDHDWGLGLALTSDLLQGSSSPCLTFGSPSLCKSKPNGDRFEVMNVELWTITPCSSKEDAEKLDLGKLFLGPTNVNDAVASSYTY